LKSYLFEGKVTQHSGLYEFTVSYFVEKYHVTNFCKNSISAACN